MANTKAPRGLYNPRLKVGGQPQHVTRRVSSAYAVDFVPGQPYKEVGSGFIEHLAVTTSTSYVGVAMSYLANPAGQPGLAANKNTKVIGVQDLLNTLWEVQASVVALGEPGYIGTNLSAPGAGWLNGADATRPQQSNLVLWGPRTTGAPFRCRGYAKDSFNEPSSADPRLVVQFNPEFIAQMAITGV